ncbi:MAG: amidohydrolase family protein [Aquabacterium sp.]
MPPTPSPPPHTWTPQRPPPGHAPGCTPELDAWLAQGAEPPVDADEPIVDPHHHLWDANAWRGRYRLGDLWADTGTGMGRGHRIVKTVFVECRSGYREDGPEHLRPVGETAFVAAMARASREGGGGPLIAGIVAHADLRLDSKLDHLLDAHEAAGDGLFRGIRQGGASEPAYEALYIPGRADPGLYADAGFRAGLARLGGRGLSFDAWHYHHQNAAFTDLARAVPGTTLVLDHLGTPLGVGPYAGQRDAIFDAWRHDMDALALCPNVCIKLGGLAMPDNGYGWHRQPRPPDSQAVLAAHGRWWRHALDCFGAARCMAESNFPVDRLSLPYGTYWNAMQRFCADLPATDRRALLHDTAARVYRLD